MLVNKYMEQMISGEDLIMVDRNELFESLKTWILQLPGVTQAAHRFGGTEFQVEGLEFISLIQVVGMSRASGESGVIAVAWVSTLRGLREHLAGSGESPRLSTVDFH